MVKTFEDAAFKAKKDEIVGPVRSDFGFHVIRVTDVKPEQGKSLAEASPEIEAELKKQAAAKRFAEVAEGLANVVYEQPTSLKPAADLFKLAVQQSGWFGKAGGAPPLLANPKILAEIFSDNAIKSKRNTAAVEVAPSVLVAARVLEHKPLEQRTLDAVRPVIESRLRREEAMKLAQAEGEAKLKELEQGKDAGLKWPAVLAVNRQKPGGLLPPVIDRVFRADPKKLPGYLGVPTPMGFSLVKVSRVIDVETIDEAKRKGLAERLQQTIAVSELESSLAGLRERIGVNVKKDALEKKASAQ
jgi:peptidyl-prolyl cis-trans isomerase D